MQNKKTPHSLEELDALCATALGNGIQGDAAALSSLAAAAKQAINRKALNTPQRRPGFRSLLRSNAPKVRKNAARLLGELGNPEDAPALKAAIEGEETLFVIPSLILALGRCGGEGDILFVEELQDRWREEADAPDTAKHRAEIRSALSTALANLRPAADIRFLSLPPLSLQLVAPENCGALLEAECAQKEIPFAKRQENVLTTSSLPYNHAFLARCFQEALVPLGSAPLPPATNQAENLQAWAHILRDALSDRLTPLGKAYAPASIPYRLELRGVDHERRGQLARAIAAALDKDGQLQNSPSHYVWELRISAEASRCSLAAKLYLPPDERFAYREETLPASIQPSTAACLMAFARPRMKESARVIDPCCGSGTLLVERSLAASLAEGVGVDKWPQAVAAARKNIAAGQRLFGAETLPLEVLGGDLRSFRPEAPFHELYANLPFGVRVGDGDEAEALYAKLIARLDDYLIPGGFALLYTTRRSSVERYGKRAGWKVADSLRLSAGGLSPWAMILTKTGK